MRGKHICRRCRTEFIQRCDPEFVVCETEPSVLYCSGYAMYEVKLCPECCESLEKFMKMEDFGYGLVE